MDSLATADRRLLAAGDHAVLALVLGWGLVHHRGLGGLLDPAALAGAVAPFLGGYLLAALLVGVFEPPADDPVAALRRVAGAWLGATGIGLVVRSSPDVAGGVAWPFGLVVLGTGALALLAWRLLVLVALERPSAAAS